MDNQITLFSGYNTENDLLPPDTAKDLYQIITSLGKKVDAYISKYNDVSQTALKQLREHIQNENNPHHLSMKDFDKTDLWYSIYLYYKNYFDTSTGMLEYNLEGLMDMFRRDPLGMLECIRRISLNDLRIVDNLLMYNKGQTRSIVKNYYTNNCSIGEIGPKGFADVPTYSYSRTWCDRSIPYMPSIAGLKDQDTKIDHLKDYFERDQGKEVTASNPAYGIPFGNLTMLNNDSIFISWDERYIKGDDSDDAKILLIMPYHKAIIIHPTIEQGRYKLTLSIVSYNFGDFTLRMSSAQTFTYYSDRAGCIFTCNNSNPIGYLSYLHDGYVYTDGIDVEYTFYNDYSCAKLYTGAIIDPDIVPISLADPNRDGFVNHIWTKPDTSIPTVGKLKSLEVTRISAIQTGIGYVPNIRYIAEKLGQL